MILELQNLPNGSQVTNYIFPKTPNELMNQ